jgi:hypothetical protein
LQVAVAVVVDRTRLTTAVQRVLLVYLLLVLRLVALVVVVVVT